MRVHDLRGSIDTVRKEIDALFLAGARRDLDLVDSVLPCLDAVASPRDLSAGPFLRGVLEFYEGDLDAAAEAFRLALSLDPDLEWDEAYGPDMKAVFEQARSASAVASMAAAQVTATMAAGVDGFVDGARIDIGPRAVAPGPHLFQVRRGDAVSTVRFVASATRVVRLYDGESAWARVVSGEAGDDVADLLGSLARARGAVRACAWTGREGGTVACWAEAQPVALVGTAPTETPAAAVSEQDAVEADPPSPVAAAEPVRKGPSGRVKSSVGVMVGGLAVFAVGGILSGVGSGVVKPIQEDYPECIDDDSDNDDLGEDVDCGQLSLDYANGYLQYLIPGGFMMVIGGTIATSGVIALLVSLGRDHDRRTLVYPRIGPGHIGLGVTSRF